jgi:beta-barrel assembly-enhancing protease
MRQHTTPMENSNIQAYVDRLGQKLAAQLPDRKVRFTFNLIAGDPCSIVHEPPALPGGFVFVPAALFLAARDEAEFAGMLAHAMAHIAAQATRPPARSPETSSAGVPRIFIGGWSGSCTDGAAVPSGFLATQQAIEREADALALHAMAQAGFDPRALVRYTERVQPAPSAARSTAYSMLPPRDQRVAAMTSIIEAMAPTNYSASVDGDEFAAAREEVRRAVATNSPAPPSLRRKMP